MELFKRLIVEEEGQGLVEYTLMVLLVALVFWVAIKDTKIGDQLSTSWGILRAALRIRTAAAQDPKGREFICLSSGQGLRTISSW